MKSLLLRLVVLVSMAGVCASKAFAEENVDDEPRRLRVTAHWENDGTYAKPNNRTDRHYTHGVLLTVAHQPQWAQQLADVVPLSPAPRDETATAAGYLFGQQIFTPQDLASFVPVTDDRPYAGYLFVGVYWQRAGNNTLDHAQLDLGLVGPAALGETIQDIAHSVSGTDKANGWGNQLGNEPTVQFTVRRKWRMDLCQFNAGELPVTLQLIPQAGVALGTVRRHLEGAVTLRLGVNLPDDFGPGRIEDIASATGSPRQGWNAYIFMRTSGRIVEHDMFLEGNTFRSSASVAEELFIGDAQAGASVGYQGDTWGIHATYSQTYTTRQFKGQEHHDGLGAIIVAMEMEF